jgi:hypothetical protein
MRDLPTEQAGTDALVATNAQRESAFLLTIKSIATPADGLAGLLDAADQSTIAVAGKASGKVKDTGKDTSGKGQGGNPKGPAKPEKKK